MTELSPENMSAVHVKIVAASLLLRFRKHHMHRIRWILHAPNFHTVALVFKDAIDARIGDRFKPTYLELNQTHVQNLRH